MVECAETADVCELQNLKTSTDPEKHENEYLAVEGSSLNFKFKSLAVLKDCNISVERGIM